MTETPPDETTAEVDGTANANRSTAENPILVYDGDCPYCSIAAVAVRQLERTDVVRWDAEQVGRFLDAQFDDRPFAMLLVDPADGLVYAGRSAAEEVAERAGTPGIVGSLVRNNYDRLAGAVGRLSARDRDPADYHGVYELSEAARNRVPALRAAATDAPDDVVETTESVDSSR